MTTFIIICVLITLAIIALLVRPLLKPSATISYQRREQNIHFAKQRLSELEKQLKNNSIAAQDYQSLKSEIESNLADDLDLAKTDSTEQAQLSEKSNAVVISLLCGLISFAALVLYQITGTPEALNIQATPVENIADNSSGQSLDDISNMALKLEQRLQQEPNDVKGWTILARTYLALRRYPESIAANKRLLELNGDDPNVYAALADATAMQANGQLAGLASEYLKTALAMDPNHFQALWMSGLAAAEIGEQELARSHWNRLMPLLADSPAQQQELQSIIDQSFSGQALPDIRPDNSDQTAPAAQGISVKVSLSSAAQQLSQPDDLVFVFAKAKNGPPAPLAVKRLQVSDLPAEVVLSDADAMMPQFRLSLFAEVVISARLAKSGNPVAQAGDIQSANVSTSNTNSNVIELIISNVIE